MKNIAIAVATLIVGVAIVMPSAAQTKAETRKQRKAEKEQVMSDSVKKMVAVEHNFRFVAQRAITKLPRQPYVTLSSFYFMDVSGDKISSALPFYGNVYSNPVSGRMSPLSFESDDFTYTVAQNDQKDKYLVQMQARAVVDYTANRVRYDITVEVFNDGSAVVNISSAQMSNMMFFGYIEGFSDEK